MTAPAGREDLGAARIGHDAERAELVAAFLDGHEGGDAAPGHRLGRARRQAGELVLDGKVGVDHARTNFRLAQQRRQAMVALRADDDVDRRLTAHNFGAFGLGEAARHDQGRAPAGLPALLFEVAELAELRVDFLGRLFADVAGVRTTRSASSTPPASA